MNPNKQYVSAVTMPAISDVNKLGVIIALYGPRGGTVCTAELSPIEASMLRDQLARAVIELKGVTEHGP